MSEIPRVRATFQALPGVVLYAGYGEGLSPAFGLYRPGYNPKPESSHQVEGGVKLRRGGLSATIAGFDLVRENGDVPDPTLPQFSNQAGEQESTGVEVDAAWSGRNGVNAYLSYGYTDARVTQDAVLPVGDRLQNTPPHAGRLFVSWAPPSGAEGLEARWRGLRGERARGHAAQHLPPAGVLHAGPPDRPRLRPLAFS